MTTRTTSADDTAVQALADVGGMCGTCGHQPGDRTCPDCERVRHAYVAALRRAGWIPAAEMQHRIDTLRAELAQIKQQLGQLTGRLTDRLTKEGTR